MRTFAVKAYQSGNDSPELNALLTADGDTAPAKKSYIEVTNGNRRDLVDSLSGMQRQAEDETKRLQQAQAEAERIAEDMAATRADAQRATDAQRSVNNRVQGELATLVREEEARRAAAAAAAAAERAAAESGPGPPPRRRRPSSSASSAAPAPRSTGGGGSSSSPAPAPAPSGPAPSIRSGLAGAIDAAVSKVGSPYVWGSAGPNSFDCSGLMVWAFKQVGISLPHYSGAQYASTTRISRAQLQPGDLVFWGSGGSEHVALYMGGNQIVHAFSSRAATGVTALDGWWKTPSGYGRI